jgi:hypothetical protein
VAPALVTHFNGTKIVNLRHLHELVRAASHARAVELRNARVHLRNVPAR